MQPEQQRAALLVGATGLIGREVLRLLLQSPRYSSVVVIARDADLLRREHADVGLTVLTFDECVTGLPEVVLKQGVDDFYCALGTTQKVSGKDGLRFVDKELVLRSAGWALAAGALKASIVSALGVSPGSPFFYNRIKGEMEQAVAELGFATTIFWQPSVLIGKRPEQRVAEELAARFLSFNFLGNFQALPGERIAQAMVAATPDTESGLFRHRVSRIKQLSQ